MPTESDIREYPSKGCSNRIRRQRVPDTSLSSRFTKQVSNLGCYTPSVRLAGARTNYRNRRERRASQDLTVGISHDLIDRSGLSGSLSRSVITVPLISPEEERSDTLDIETELSILCRATKLSTV